jgi:alpha-tubulin suppressor-like RCC1 family protein
MAGFTVNGVDLDNLFDPIGSTTPRAAVNLRINNTDISNIYAQASSGTAYTGTLNLRTNGTDIGSSLYAEIGSVSYSGALWVWGRNQSGQHGDNTSISKSSPVQTIAGGTNWKQVAFDNSTAAIKTDGTLWTWGYNYFGSLGDNTTIDRSSPVQTVAGGTSWKQVASGNQNMLAIR